MGRLDQTGTEVHRPFVHTERAELARLLGDEAGRQRELQQARRAAAWSGFDADDEVD